MSTVASEFAVTKKELNWFFRQGVKGGRNLLWDDGMFLYLIGGDAALVVGESRQEGACYEIGHGNALRSAAKASKATDRITLSVSEDGEHWTIECDTLGTMSYDAEVVDDLVPDWLKHSGKVRVEISPETSAEMVRLMPLLDTDQGRYTLGCVHVERNDAGDGALAVATNGRALAVLEIDCEISDEEAERRPSGYLLHEEILKHARMTKQGLCVVESPGVDCIMSGTAFLCGTDGNYPRWRSVLDDAVKDTVLCTTLESVDCISECERAIAKMEASGEDDWPAFAVGEVSLNARYVKDIIKLFDGHPTEASVAEDRPGSKPVVFRSAGKPELTVVLMPLTKD